MSKSLILDMHQVDVVFILKVVKAIKSKDRQDSYKLKTQHQGRAIIP